MRSDLLALLRNGWSYALMLRMREADPADRARFGWRLYIGYAAEWGRVDCLRVLMNESGVSPDAVDFHWTGEEVRLTNACVRAAAAGRLDCLRVLIEEFGADGLKSTQCGTPIDAAVGAGWPDVVEYLLERGAIPADAVPARRREAVNGLLRLYKI